MTSTENYTISIEPDASPDDVGAVFDGLMEYNRAYTEFERRDLRIFVRDVNGKVIGGVLGESIFGWLHIGIFWLDESLRRNRLGSKLLAMAEAEARERGDKYIYLTTFSFQARPFYEKNGYECFATQEDFPVGHTRYFMKKTL